MTINNRGLMGQPSLPYVDYLLYAGQDVFVDLAFVDHTDTPVTPVTLSYRVDDMTNALNMAPMTNVVAGLAQTMTVTIPSSIWVMSKNFQGSQICQIFWTFTAVDSVTGATFTATAVTIVELVAIQTPN